MEARTHQNHDALEDRLVDIPPGVATLYRELVNVGMRVPQDEPAARLSRRVRYWEVKATLLEVAQGATSEASFWPQALEAVCHLFGAQHAVWWEAEHDRLMPRHHAGASAPHVMAPMTPLIQAAIESGEVETVTVPDAEGVAHVCLLAPVKGHGTVGVLQLALGLEMPKPELADEVAIAAAQLASGLASVRRLDRLAYQASHDALTGLANRRHYDEYVDREFKLARRHNTPMSILAIDVDYFKRYNDTYGHPAGDRLLVALSGALTHAVRQSDFVARMGGEEFAVVLPFTDERGALAAAEKIQANIRSLGAHPDVLGGRVTASVGVATGHGYGCDPQALLQAADEALYQAKQGGRNRIHQYAP